LLKYEVKLTETKKKFTSTVMMAAGYGGCEVSGWLGWPVAWGRIGQHLQPAHAGGGTWTPAVGGFG
jgi:hypothetical protein